MAATGNHGVIIPRDGELLHRLYWGENKTTIDMGQIFGVTHRSVIRVMRDLGVPTRSKGVKPVRLCRCGAPTLRIKHQKNGATYGRRCLACHRARKAAFAKAYRTDEQKRLRRNFFYRRWYDFGSLNPQGDKSWIVKCKALLRTTKRAATSKKRSLALSPSANVALRRGQTLPA